MHLAEIYLDNGRYDDAEALLIPVISSGDPEVLWRLADVSAALERDAEAVKNLKSARRGFASLLSKHLLAFADHGAAFYAGSGDDPERALELASINAANRPTARADCQPPPDSGRCLVPLGSLLAELGQFNEADQVRQGLRS